MRCCMPWEIPDDVVTSVKVLSRHFRRSQVQECTQHLLLKRTAAMKVNIVPRPKNGNIEDFERESKKEELALWYKTFDVDVDVDVFKNHRSPICITMREKQQVMKENLNTIITMCTMFANLGLIWRPNDLLRQYAKDVKQIVENYYEHDLFYFLFHREKLFFAEMHEIFLASIADLNEFYDSLKLQAPAALASPTAFASSTTPTPSIHLTDSAVVTDVAMVVATDSGTSSFMSLFF